MPVRLLSLPLSPVGARQEQKPVLGRVAVGRGGWLTLRPGPAVLAGAAGGAVRRVRAGAGGPSRSRRQREAPQRSRWPGRSSAAAPSPCGARGRALRPSVIRRPPAGLASVAGLGQRRPTVVPPPLRSWASAPFTACSAVGDAGVGPPDSRALLLHSSVTYFDAQIRPGCLPGHHFLSESFLS